MRKTITLVALACCAQLQGCGSGDNKSLASAGGGTAGSAESAAGAAGTSAVGVGGTGGASGGSAGTGQSAGGGGAGGETAMGGNAGTAGAGGDTLGEILCGAERPALNLSLEGSRAEGLVIAPDGTLYVSQPPSQYVGRYKPPYDSYESKWADIGATGNNFGITFDPERNALFLGSRGAGKLFRISAADASVTSAADVEGLINGVTLGEDGAVYYSNQNGDNGHVFRVDPDAAPPMRKTQVTTQPLDDPNGIVFGEDGWMYAVSWAGQDVVRFKVVDGQQMGDHETVVTLPSNHADGIAIDQQGRIFVTASGRLYRIETDGEVMELPTNGVGSANLDFGAGALGCADLYSAGSAVFRFESDAEGQAVPWHRSAP